MTKAPQPPRARGPAKPARKVADIPDPATVVSEATLTSPKGTRFRILRTTQADAYDKPAKGKNRR